MPRTKARTDAQAALFAQTSLAVQLREPKLAAQTQFETMLSEIGQSGETQHHGVFTIAKWSFDKYLDLLTYLKNRDDHLSARYPIETFFIYYENALAGELRYRERLAPEMEDLGGHVTLYVRPSLRRKGIGNEALRKMLEIAIDRQRIITMVLTCLSNNVAAIRIMQENGGTSIPDIDAPVGVFKRYRFFLDRPD